MTGGHRREDGVQRVARIPPPEGQEPRAPGEGSRYVKMICPPAAMA